MCLDPRDLFEDHKCDAHTALKLKGAFLSGVSSCSFRSPDEIITYRRKGRQGTECRMKKLFANPRRIESVSKREKEKKLGARSVLAAEFNIAEVSPFILTKYSTTTSVNAFQTEYKRKEGKVKRTEPAEDRD